MDQRSVTQQNQNVRLYPIQFNLLRQPPEHGNDVSGAGEFIFNKILNPKNSEMEDFYHSETRCYDVEYYVVSVNIRTGAITKMTYISPLFETIEQARKFKANALAKYPDCFVEDRVEFFSSEDDVNRKELLTQIIKADQAV